MRVCLLLVLRRGLINEVNPSDTNIYNMWPSTRSYATVYFKQTRFDQHDSCSVSSRISRNRSISQTQCRELSQCLCLNMAKLVGD